MWPGLRKYVKAVLNLVTAVVLLCLTVFLLPRLLRFFMPFAVGWIIAMIANPLVRFCEQKIRIRRKAGSAIVIVAVLAGVILVGYLLISRLVTEAAGFVSSLPTLWRDVEREMDELAAGLADFYDRFPPALKENLTEIGDNLGSYISGIVNGLSDPTAAFARGLGWGPGTAGTSLKEMAAAASMMDWAEANGAANRSAGSLHDCLAGWYDGLDAFDQENFAEAWPLIEDAAQRILEDPEGQASWLEDAGVEETPTCSEEDWAALAGAMNAIVPAPQQ